MTLRLWWAVCCVVLALAVSNAQQRPAAPDVAIDADDIGGVVTGPGGPEAGVWVIAETRDLPVRYIKSVVTDDRGRFVVPTCPRPATRCGRGATDWWTAQATAHGVSGFARRSARAKRSRRGALLPRSLDSMLKIPAATSRRKEQHTTRSEDGVIAP